MEFIYYPLECMCLTKVSNAHPLWLAGCHQYRGSVWFIWVVKTIKVSLDYIMTKDGRGWDKTVDIYQYPFKRKWIVFDYLFFFFFVKVEKNTFSSQYLHSVPKDILICYSKSHLQLDLLLGWIFDNSLLSYRIHLFLQRPDSWSIWR